MTDLDARQRSLDSLQIPAPFRELAVRMTSEQHDLATAETKGDLATLTDDRAAARALTRAEAGQRSAQEADLTRAGGESAGQRPHQRRLAGAVGPRHADELARAQQQVGRR